MILTELQTSWTVLLVGMTATFVILGLVVFVARLVILFTNRFAESDHFVLQGSTFRGTSKSNVPQLHLQVIEKAVQEVTEGNFTIEKIRIKNS